MESTTAVFVGGGRPHLDSLRDLLGSSEETLLATAYVRRSGVDLIKDELKRLCKEGGSARVLTTFDFGLTEPAALEQLEDLGAQVRVAQLGGRAYHPKIYLGRSSDSFRVLVGSANLTACGLLKNVEASVSLGGAGAGGVYAEAAAEMDKLWSSGETHDLPRRLKSPLVTRSPRVVPELQIGVEEDLAAPLRFRDRLAPATEDDEFDEVWQRIERFCQQRAPVYTATGVKNLILDFDVDRGILIGTIKSPKGQWVDRSMFERTLAGLQRFGALPLNTPKGSDQPDCTRYLRVHRSSAVYALLGALEGFQIFRKGRSTILGRVP